MNERSIWIISVEQNTLVDKGGTSKLLSQNLPLNTLKSNLSDFICNIEASLEGINQTIHNFNLDEIEMSIAISVNGGISLVGSVEAGTTGGINLKFKRNCHE